MIHTSGHILIFWEEVVKLVELWLQVVEVTKLLKLGKKQTSCNVNINMHILLEESMVCCNIS